MWKQFGSNGFTAAAVLVLFATALLSAEVGKVEKSKPAKPAKATTKKSAAKADTKNSSQNKAKPADAEKPTAKPQTPAKPQAPAKTETSAAPAKPAPPKPATPPPAKLSTARAALVALIRQAKGKFDAGPLARRDEGRRRVVAAVEDLNRYLSRGDQRHGDDWKAYLDLPRLQAEVAKPKDVDAAVLTDSLTRLNGGYDGLELAPFREAAEALAEFSPLVAVADRATKADYDKTLDELSEAITAGGEYPNAATAQSIARTVAWLNANEQAGDVVAAVESEYSQPNLFVDVNESMIRDALSDPIDEVAPVRDCILGTSISGCGRTIGRLAVDFVDSAEMAVIRANFCGTNYSNTVGHNRSAVIYTRGQTQLEATKTLFVDEHGIRSSTSTAHAQVSTQITGIGSTKRGLMGRIVQRVAAKKAPQQKPQAEQIGARHAEARLLDQLDRTAGDAMQRSNSDLEVKLRRPLKRFDAEPELLKFSTTADALHVRALQTAHGRMAAPSQAPQFGGEGIVVRLHQSFVENTARQLLAGRTYDRDRLDDLSRQFGLQPPPPDEDETPFSITFVDDDPIAFLIDEGRVSVSVHGKQFTSGEDHKPYDGMSITAHYAVESDGESVRLTRQGDLEILPLGFRSGVDRLTLSQTTFKRILQRKFEKLLPTEHVGHGVTLDGDLRRVGRFVAAKLRADDGWLSIDLARRTPTTAAWTVNLPILEAE